MANSPDRSKKLVRISIQLLLWILALALPAAALAANNCPWMNEATASSLLGGDSVVQVSAAPGQPTVCTFTETEANAVRTLSVTVEIAGGPHTRVAAIAQSCAADAAPLTAIGNEAITCAADDRKAGPGEKVVGRVRDQVFTIRIGSTLKKDPALTRETLQSKIYTAAEQVAGNLY